MRRVRRQNARTGRTSHPQNVLMAPAIHNRAAGKRLDERLPHQCHAGGQPTPGHAGRTDEPSPNGDDRPGNQEPQRSDGACNAGHDPLHPTARPCPGTGQLVSQPGRSRFYCRPGTSRHDGHATPQGRHAVPQEEQRYRSHTAKTGAMIGNAMTSRRSFVCHSVASPSLRPGTRNPVPQSIDQFLEARRSKKVRRCLPIGRRTPVLRRFSSHERPLARPQAR